MAFDPKDSTYLKDHFSYFTVEELAAAYALFDTPENARAQAEYEFADPEDRVIAGDTFAAIASVSPAAAERMADLLDEPIEVVWAIRDELLSRLHRFRELRLHLHEGTQSS